jgi:hypothetical protein
MAAALHQQKKEIEEGHAEDYKRNVRNKRAELVQILDKETAAVLVLARQTLGVTKSITPAGLRHAYTKKMEDFEYGQTATCLCVVIVTMELLLMMMIEVGVDGFAYENA